MNYILECTILEVVEKSFTDKTGATRPYYIAQAYQPGVGVDTISITKDAADNVAPGKNAFYKVEFAKDNTGKGKPRIVGVC